MKFAKKLGWIATVGGVVIVGAIVVGMSATATPSSTSKTQPGSDVAQKPILTVTAVKRSPGQWADTLSANGNIAAWQEAIIGSELSGQRLADVLVNVGDVVKPGQLLARFADESVAADLADARASLEEARANLAQAEADVARLTRLSAAGGLSEQQKNAYVTTGHAASARVKAAQARVQMQEIRMRQTRVLAPDGGLISKRTATLGAVPSAGEELFRLIRNNRLEWRAEVPAEDLLRIQPGQAVNVRSADGGTIAGKVRVAAPAIDTTTRNAIVYVDLPIDSPARAGSFVSGEFLTGESAAQTLPDTAVVMNDGFAYVFCIDDQQRVSKTRVKVGRRQLGRIEILSGIEAPVRVVDHGAGFLADGDTVQVVDAPALATAHSAQ
jgi:RND family efflux transporter MFP subunit